MISRRYLEQLAIALKRESLLRGVSGRTGGYLLGRPANEITVRDIIEATIGPVNVVDCVRNPEGCVMAEACECRNVYELINDGIISLLGSLTLADLLKRPKLRKQSRGSDGLQCPVPNRS